MSACNRSDMFFGPSLLTQADDVVLMEPGREDLDGLRTSAAGREASELCLGELELLLRVRSLPKLQVA